MRLIVRPSSAEKPMGTVPVLELDDGTCIAESAAICRYFEESQPEPPLLGVDATDRAVVAMWDRRMEFELLLPIADSFRQHHAFFKAVLSSAPSMPRWPSGGPSKIWPGSTRSWPTGSLSPATLQRGRYYRLCAVDFVGCRRSALRRSRKIWRAGMKPCRRGRAPRPRQEVKSQRANGKGRGENFRP